MLDFNERRNLNNEFGFCIEELEKWKENFMKKIQDYLIKFLNPKNSDVKYYNDLLAKLQEINKEYNLKIITTNYDLLLDKSLDGNWNDGFTPNIYGDSIKKWANKWDLSSQSTLVKLHGSISWDDSRKHKKQKNRGIFKHQNAGYPTPMMLPLTHKDKEYWDEPYKGMFTRFRQIVADVDLLVVIGYTFRDRKIYDIIRGQLEKNLHVLLLTPNARQTASARFKKSDVLAISKVGDTVYCNTKNNSRVYCCDIKFEYDTIDDIVKLVRRMSEMINTNLPIPHDPNIREFK